MNEIARRDRLTQMHVSASAWNPSERQIAYRDAIFDPRIPPTIAARAEAAQVSRQTVYNWMRDADFHAWLSNERRLAFEHRIEDVKQKCIELALRGSAEHMRLVLEMAGELPGRGGRRDEAGGVSSGHPMVFINVPRPLPVNP